MAVLKELNYWFLPTLQIVCKKDTEANLDLAALKVAQYWFLPTVVVNCIVKCEDGTEWNEECGDCVPVCFPDMLAMLQIINAKLPAKIIG